MVPLIAAFQFLTIIPTLIRRLFTPQEMGRAAGWFPLVGLALGGLLYGLHTAAALAFPASVAAALTLAAWVVATRALHLDGFMDTCDGLFGGFTPERRLEIMRDSRVGAFGVAGVVLLLLAKYAALTASPRLFPALLLGPVMGRWVLSLAIFACPYARPSGLGRDMKDNTGWPQAALSTLIALAAAWLFGSWLGLAALGLAGLTLLLGAGYILRLLPGLTGDSYGALCESVELVVLLVFCLQV